jgi:very-short-patch-repair endonuclease
MAGSRKQARYLRNNSTYPEVKLWNCLKQDQIGYMFKRQWLLGGYILDFYCSELKLAIEIDGKIHGLKVERDQARDAYLVSEGIHLVRIPARRIYRSGIAAAIQLKEICENLSRGISDIDR